MLLYDYSFLCSGLINVLAFLYGFILMVTKSIYRKHKHKVVACVEMITGRETSSLAHSTTKAIMNILSSTVLVSTGIYITVGSKVCYNPFFAYDHNIALAITLLFTVCVFNMVLTLLTETVTARNIHEVPTYMVKSLVSVAILIREENAVAGVVCLYMFGSVLSDELLNLASVTSDKTKRRSSKWAHIFHLSMHLLCNFLLPLIMFLAPTWFSKRSIFQMGTSSIVIFFFAATFFVLCNTWRLMCAWRQIVGETENVNIDFDSKAQTEVWQANNISATIIPMLNKGLIKILPTPSRIYSNELVIKDSGNYLTIDGIEEDKSTKGNKLNQENAQEQTMYASQFDGQFEKIDVNVIF